jgi:hypothetical protein
MRLILNFLVKVSRVAILKGQRKVGKFHDIVFLQSDKLLLIRGWLTGDRYVWKPTKEHLHKPLKV